MASAVGGVGERENSQRGGEVNERKKVADTTNTRTSTSLAPDSSDALVDRRVREMAELERLLTWIGGDAYLCAIGEINPHESMISIQEVVEAVSVYVRGLLDSRAQAITDLTRERDEARRAFVRLAIPTAALLMDKPSHKYISPDIIEAWERELAGFAHSQTSKQEDK
jgi:hypothetical protein